MLSPTERKEILQDGLNPKRREEFRKTQKFLELKPSRSFDEYIRFLMDVQKIFKPFIPSRKKTETRLNKL